MMTQRMVVMANQIADNVPDRGRAAEETAVHLRSFWTPAMLTALREYARTHPHDLEPNVHRALALIDAP